MRKSGSFRTISAPSLSFSIFLAFKEAQARRDEDEELTGGYLLAQRDFLERTGRMVPHFFARLQRSSEVPFYIELAGLPVRVYLT